MEKKNSDLLREGQLPWAMKMKIPLSIYWQMQRASSKDICRLTEGDCLDSTALPTFTPDSKMGTLSWGKVLQPTIPNFKLLYTQKIPLQWGLESFYEEGLFLFLCKIGIFGIWPHSGELPEVGADSDRDRGNVIKLVIFVIIRPCSVTVRHPSPLY